MSKPCRWSEACVPGVEIGAARKRMLAGHSVVFVGDAGTIERKRLGWSDPSSQIPRWPQCMEFRDRSWRGRSVHARGQRMARP